MIRKNFLKKLLDLIYPPRCPVCHDVIEPGYDMICGGCLEKVSRVGEFCCRICGKPVKEQEQFCHDCMEQPHEFKQGISLFVYDDVMRKSIAHFKYMGRKEYGRFYAAAAWNYHGTTLKQWNIQVLVPVPVHRSRKAVRGYNQAEVIAKELSSYMGCQVITDAVRRKEKTKAQKELSRKERQNNLKHAFVKGRNPFPWKRVLLIDDIYTTGSTADAVCRILKEMGAAEIYLLSVCIGKGFMV